MDSYENRRIALANAMHARCNGKQVTLAQTLGIRPDYVSRMLTAGKNAKRISGDFAREIERKLGLPPLWLDQPQSAGAMAVVPASRANVVSVPPLQHESHRVTDDFWGVPMFAVDVEKMGQRVENLRAALITDAGMSCQRGMRDYVAVVDVQTKAPSDGDIFLIEHGNKLKMRRMMLDGKHWVGRSDVGDAATFPDVPIEDPKHQVIGRVVWGCGMIG